MPVEKHTTLGSVSGGFMITRAPWPAPSNKYYVLRKVLISNASAVSSGSVFGFWDQDLSNTTPVGRGSGAAPLVQIPITAALSGITGGAFVSQDQCPPVFFQAGVCVNSVPANASGVSISLELDVV